MKKFTPYLLIVAVIIIGYFVNAEILKQFKQSEGSETKSVTDKRVSINDNLKTLLVYPKKKNLLEFELWDFNQQKFSKSNFKNKWNLIFIGYTNCPDVCPNTLNDLTHLYQALNKELRKKFQFIFFSVDPMRDTPERMKAYLDNFNNDFVGISGKKEQIDSLVHQLGGLYSLNTEEGDYYTVDHSGRIFIVDPEGRRFGILKSDVLQSLDKSILVNELESLL
ncbi:MAG: hypothetical protein COB38_04565 [Gammaproteobacteria bacterium]|nr:MAG: hypothetical protein COB38_04565 [Gammaproteobacteria bacterium]